MPLKGLKASNLRHLNFLITTPGFVLQLQQQFHQPQDERENRFKIQGYRVIGLQVKICRGIQGYRFNDLLPCGLKGCERYDQNIYNQKTLFGVRLPIACGWKLGDFIVHNLDLFWRDNIKVWNPKVLSNNKINKQS